MDCDEAKLTVGFDRGVDYDTCKNDFIVAYNKIKTMINNLNESNKRYDTRKRSLFIKIIYLLISMISLRNGSRVSESVRLMNSCIASRNFNKMYSIKISKSASKKTNKEGEIYYTKTRYRNMVFPQWIKVIDVNTLVSVYGTLDTNKLKKRTLDYLNYNFNSINTHSLRYAYINYLLNKGTPLCLISKSVGHSNMQTIQTYTQTKNVNNILNDVNM